MPAFIAAIAYPLGNRKKMQVADGQINALQRTLGMTIASLPFWILLSMIGMSMQVQPTEAQLYQTLIVAICSGVIATVLFFMATDKVRKNERALAYVEATQSAEVLFALVGEIIILKTHFPDTVSMIGIALVIIGMLLHSLASEKEKTTCKKQDCVKWKVNAMNDYQLLNSKINLFLTKIFEPEENVLQLEITVEKLQNKAKI